MNYFNIEQHFFHLFNGIACQSARSQIFFSFAIKYHRENEKDRKTVYVCSCGAQVESFKQKKAKKSGDTATLNITKKMSSL